MLNYKHISLPFHSELLSIPWPHQKQGVRDRIFDAADYWTEIKCKYLILSDKIQHPKYHANRNIMTNYSS